MPAEEPITNFTYDPLDNRFLQEDRQQRSNLFFVVIGLGLVIGIVGSILATWLLAIR